MKMKTPSPSSSSVEIVKEFYSQFRAGNRERFLQLCDDGIEWNIMQGAPNGGRHVGKKAVFEEYFPRLFSYFEEFHAVPGEFLAAGGELVLVLGSYRIKSRKARREYTVPFAHVYTVRDGRITRFVQYADTAIIQQALSS